MDKGGTVMKGNNKGSSSSSPSKTARQRQNKKNKKKKKNPKRQATENKTYTDLVPRSSTQKKKKKGGLPGHYCDICLQKDGFRNLTLLKCHQCGLTVHGNCYGMPQEDEDDDDGEAQQDRTTGFECWACAAVGKQIKVRERDPFTSRRISVKQRDRPRECCLCSVQEGNHAMHPIYDAHGRRGRQIWLPPPSTTSKGGERKLAWAHTLCALALNANPFTSGTCYGCNGTGFYGDPDDLECVSESESVNSELDVDEGTADEGAADIHHFVYWGYYDRFMGRDADQWGKAIENHKRGLHCGFCGKDDSKMTRLSNGSQVFQTLRVPLQCTANNDEEFEEFRPHHKTDDPCYQALHVGCALWGRNEAGEQSLARRVWYFPGMPDSPNPDLQNPVVEVYCDRHAQDLFENVASSNTQKRGLPGPFYTTTKKKKNNNKTNASKKNAPVGVSATVGAGASAPLHMKATAKSNKNSAKTVPKSVNARNPMQAQQRTSQVLGGKKRAAADHPQEGDSTAAKLQKTSKAAVAGRAQRSGTGPVGNPIIPGTSRLASSAPPEDDEGKNTKLSRKRVHESTSADAVALNQDKRTSKLVRDKKKHSDNANKTFGSIDDEDHLELTQTILDDLLFHKKQCKARKEPFKGTKIQRRLHWRSEVDLTQEEFSLVWKNAVSAIPVGNLDELKKKIAESKKGTSGVQQVHTETSNANPSTEVPLPQVPRRNSMNTEKSNQSKPSKRGTDGEGDDGGGGGDAFDVESEKANNDSAQLAQSANQDVSQMNEPTSQTNKPSSQVALEKRESDPKGYSAVESTPTTLEHGTSDKPLTDEERQRKERIQKIVDDVVSKIDPLQPKDDVDEAAEAERSKEVGLTLKACRTHWRKQLNLPKAEYKVLFDEALTKVLTICTWFKVQDRSPAPVAAPEPSSVTDPAEQPPVSNADPATADEPLPPEENGMEENIAPPSHNHDDTTAKRVSSPPVENGQWSYLSIGKNFNKRGFSFDAWDTYEELPPKKK